MEIKKNRVDFHTHANPLSFESGKNVVDLAVESGVTAIAIFAREQVLPYYDELIKYGNSVNVKVITGVETLSMMGNTPVQIIGLGYDHKKMSESNNIPQKESNIRIANLQKQFLETKGFTFDGPLEDEQLKVFESVLNGDVAEKAIRLCEVVATLSSNTQLFDSLIEKHKDAWIQILDKYTEYYKGSMARLKSKLLYQVYFDVNKEGFNYFTERYQRRVPTIEDQINEIHKSGGVALYSPEGSFDIKLWKFLSDKEIDGLMAWHADQMGYHRGESDIPKDVIKECIKNDMLILGGSDYDGGNWKIGTGSNNMFISPKRLNKLASIILKK